MFVVACRSFAEALGCDIKTLKMCAKKKSFQDVLAAQQKVFQRPNFLPFSPVVDGYFMPGMHELFPGGQSIKKKISKI